LLARLNVRRLDHVVEALRSGAPTGEIFLDLVAWPAGERHDLVAEVRHGAATSAARIAPWLVALADRYPDDAGVAAAALLNHVELQPGQGLYVDPGQIHAHLHGTGVEILGGSDNVVRAGLTPKHVAVNELRRMLSLGAVKPAVVEPTSEADGEERWRTPRPEFALSRLRVAGSAQQLTPRGAQILFCVEGKVDVSTGGADGEATVPLSSGESAFVAANAEPATIVGQGVILRATTGLSFVRSEA
jgi:mannose-6-phosphate isomerase